jgi:hypothetical protein
MAHRRQETHLREGDGALALAQGLGWFSIGLGVAELVAPEQLGRFLGMEEHTALLRAYGAREIATGIGILTQDDPTPWLWGRVGGDVLDLGTLALGLSPDNPQRGNVGMAMAAVAGVTALDIVCAQRLGAERERFAAPTPNYGDRRGLPLPPDAMRGAARDALGPRDMRVPEPLRPYQSA